MTRLWRPYPRLPNLLYAAPTSSFLRGVLMRRREAGRGAVPLRAWLTPVKHSGRRWAPPGSITRPCQELADDRKVHTKRWRSPLSTAGRGERNPNRKKDRSGTLAAKAGPAPENAASAHVALSLRYMSAYGAPRGARAIPKRIASYKIALFGAPSPLARGEITEPRTLKRVAERSPHVCVDGATNSIPPLDGEGGALLSARRVG